MPGTSPRTVQETWRVAPGGILATSMRSLWPDAVALSLFSVVLVAVSVRLFAKTLE